MPSTISCDQAHLAPRRVEDAGDRPVGRVVLRHVGVEQQERHAADLRDPDLEMELAVAERDRDQDTPRPVWPAAGRIGRREKSYSG